MSVKSAPYYWVECDGCGAISTESSEHSAWVEAAYAIDHAMDVEWAEYTAPTSPRPGVRAGDDIHLCPKCAPRDGEGCLWEELP